MKHTEQLRKFEKEFNVQTWQDLEGIWWNYDNKVYGIEKQALGVYKRYDMDMLKVMKLITFNKRYNETLNTALRLKKRFKKENEYKLRKSLENDNTISERNE